MTLRGMHWEQRIIPLNQVVSSFSYQTSDSALKFMRKKTLSHPKQAGLLNWILLRHLVLYFKQSRNRYIEVGFQSLERFWETGLMKWRMFQIIFLSYPESIRDYLPTWLHQVSWFSQWNVMDLILQSHQRKSGISPLQISKL